MKRAIKSTYFWSLILLIVGIAGHNSENAVSALASLAGLSLLAFSVVKSIYQLIMRLFKKPVSSSSHSSYSDPVRRPLEPIDEIAQPVAISDHPNISETPLKIQTVEVSKRTAQSATVKNIHNIERFHKLENNVFSRKARKNGFVVFDLETTGLKAYDRICEIAAIKYDNQFHALEGFETLVNPERAIAPEASARSGIYDDMVSDSPTIDQVLPVFFSFVEGYPLIGYNAERFDIRYLNNAVNKCGINCAIEYADALPWARNHYNLSSYKLGDVAESIGVSTANAHRAMGDCRMLGAIVRDMMM